MTNSDLNTSVVLLVIVSIVLTLQQLNQPKYKKDATGKESDKIDMEWVGWTVVLSLFTAIFGGWFLTELVNAIQKNKW